MAKQSNQTALLSSAEAEQRIADTRAAMSAAVAAGDSTRYRELRLDLDFFEASAEAARKREDEAREAERIASLNAARPAAMTAVVAADPRNAFSSQIQKWKAAVAMLAEVAKEWPDAVKRFGELQDDAREKARVAQVPFAPTAVNESITRGWFHTYTHAALFDADVPQASALMFPAIKLATRATLMSPNAHTVPAAAMAAERRDFAAEMRAAASPNASAQATEEE